MVSRLINIRIMFESAFANFIATFKAEGIVAALALLSTYMLEAIMPVGYMIFGLIILSFFETISGMFAAFKKKESVSQSIYKPILRLLVYLCLILSCHTVTLMFELGDILTYYACMLISFYILIKIVSDVEAFTNISIKEKLEEILSEKIKNLIKTEEK